MDPEIAIQPFVVDYRMLLEGSLDIVWLVRVKGHSHQYLYCSPSVVSILGWMPVSPSRYAICDSRSCSNLRSVTSRR